MALGTYFDSAIYHGNGKRQILKYIFFLYILVHDLNNYPQRIIYNSVFSKLFVMVTYNYCTHCCVLETKNQVCHQYNLKSFLL